jgi:glucose-1-phosphate thymidylyltransferase
MTRATVGDAGDLIGVVPLAGSANRISPLPMSKELFPIGFRTSAVNGEPRAKPVCLYLLEQMRQAGVGKAFLVLRPGKWDIPAYLQDGAMTGIELAYLVMPYGYGVPYTVDRATAFVAGARVAFGYPDIIIEEDGVFARIAEVQAETGDDVVLAAFPCDDPDNWGMIDVDDGLRVRHLAEKPGRTGMTLTWGAAVWGPAFTRFMHQRLAEMKPDIEAQRAAGVATEVQIADVIKAAIDHGLAVRAHLFPHGRLRDIGRPSTLVEAVQDFACPDDTVRRAKGRAEQAGSD